MLHHTTAQHHHNLYSVRCVCIDDTRCAVQRQVEHDLAEIDSKIEALRDLHRKRLMVTFDADEGAQDAGIEAAAKVITGLFHKAERGLKKIQAGGGGAREQVEGPAAAPPSASEQKLRANIVRTLAGRLQACSVTFRRAQKDFLGRRSEQKGGSAGGFDFLDAKHSASSSGGGGPGLALPGLDGGVLGAGMTLEQLEVVDDLEETVAQR